MFHILDNLKNKTQNTYGLIGKDINYSFSPSYFKSKFQQENISDSTYKLFSLDKIVNFAELLKNTKNLKGLNITIPYKQEIIPFLDKLDSAAKEIQAVNTIQFKNNELIGYNTDVLGFEKSLLPLLQKHHKKALVFGTGGASKAIVYVLKKLEIPYKLVSRSKTDLTYSDIDKNRLKNYQILINTTPLGTFPDVETCPDIDYYGISEKHLAFDLVYNPEESTFLRKAKKQGATIKNGLEMLEIQAEESWKIWNNKS